MHALLEAPNASTFQQHLQRHSSLSRHRVRLQKPKLWRRRAAGQPLPWDDKFCWLGDIALSALGMSERKMLLLSESRMAMPSCSCKRTDAAACRL